MEKVVCPLCGGSGKLVVRKGIIRRRVMGEIDCPVCKGRGWIYELNDGDLVDVEIFGKGRPDEHVVIHIGHSINPLYRDDTMSLGTAIDRWGWQNVYFCEHCYGEYVLYKGKLVRCTG